MEPPKEKRKGLRGRALAVLLGTLVALLAAELIARVANPEARQLFRAQTRRESERGKFCRYDATLGWAGIANADADFDYVDTHHHVRQNAYGFRGRELPLARSAVRRLVVLGDSFAWGFGVEDEQLFTEILGRSASPALEVANLGVSGYGTDQELLLWRQLGQRFRPDLVLLLVTPYTDVYDVLYAERYDYAKPRFRLDAGGSLALENVPVPTRPDRAWYFEATESRPVRRRVLLDAASRSAFLGSGLLALARVPALRARMERAGWLPPRLPGSDWETRMFGRPMDEETRAGFMLMDHLIAQLADEVRASGGELVVAAVPTAVQVYPALQDDFRVRHRATASGEWDFEAPRRMMEELCRVARIRCIDLLPDLAAAGRDDPYLYYRWNLHWTAAGHRVVAATLARALRAP